MKNFVCSFEGTCEIKNVEWQFWLLFSIFFCILKDKKVGEYYEQNI